jgi:hypothetical protein
VTKFLADLSPFSAETYFITLVLLLAGFVAVPIAVTFYLKRERRRRRKLVNSPRKIALAGEEKEAAPCEHLRSKSRARQAEDGRFVSTCKKCGAAMVRNGPGDWVVAQQAETPPSEAARPFAEGLAGESEVQRPKGLSAGA